ncbi:MAG TPA: hypothetical protein VLG47_02390 [Candidatus Saccharimonadales bacterium]|nr:hypothetical protein [Candidatus Saccharimonadales bacterium]
MAGLAELTVFEGTIDESLCLQRQAAVAGYVAAVGMCRWAREVMLDADFGQIVDGLTFETPQFVIGRSEVYRLGGAFTATESTARLRIYDAPHSPENYFQCALFAGDSDFSLGAMGRPADGRGTGARGSAARLISLLLNPDSADIRSREMVFATYRSTPDELKSTAFPSAVKFMCSQIIQQSECGMNILKLTVRALADENYNPQQTRLGEVLLTGLIFSGMFK